MKTTFLKVITFIFCITGAVHAEENITVRTQDNGMALVNPGMGWMAYFYSNVPTNYGSHLSPADTVDDFPGLSTVFLRIPWAMLEPKEGKFNWALLDTPAQRWISKGKRVALCLTSSENWMNYATPEWVKNAGAKGTFYEFGKGRVEQGQLWDPFFDDPVYLAKLDAFLAAAAKRYDGNPNVEFVTIGTYGLWGEGHTHMSSQQDSFDIQKTHIDLHLKHFRKTQLAISDDYVGHNIPGKSFPITDYALSRGVTLRDDSILVQPPPNSWYHSELAQAFWPKFPVILEHEHYGGSKAKGAWDGALLLKAVEDYHASFLSIHWAPRDFLRENRETINRINQRLGYRLQPLEVTWSKDVEIATPEHFKVKWTWANKGVAPCYIGAFPCLTLKDAQGGIISVMTDESLDMRDLKVGTPGQPPVTAHVSQFTIGQFAPATQPGSYDLFISVGTRDGTPTIALPQEGHDGQRRYRLGTVTLQNPGDHKPQPEPINAVPIERMRQVYDEVKTPFKYGVVIRGEKNQMVDSPSVFRYEGQWYMVYIANTGEVGYETFLARSADLLNWEKLGKILGFPQNGWDRWQRAGGVALCDPTWGGASGLQAFDGKYWMSYLGGALQGYETDPLAIGLAWSKTPGEAREWTPLAENPVLSRDQADVRAFEKETLYRSQIIWDKEKRLGAPFVMYYNGKIKSAYEKIGMAVSDDMIHWKRYGTEPVMANGEEKHHGISGDPQIVKMGDLWVMFYFGAFWRPGAFDTFACSTDLVHWTKWNGPDLVQSSEPWDKQFAHKPWVLKHEGVVYHFYCAVGDQGRVIALATSRDLKIK